MPFWRDKILIFSGVSKVTRICLKMANLQRKPEKGTERFLKGGKKTSEMPGDHGPSQKEAKIAFKIGPKAGTKENPLFEQK